MGKKIFIGLAIGLLTLLGSAGAAYAVAEASGWSGDAVADKTVVVENGQSRSASFYAAAETIKIDGEIQGDLYCAAQNLEITGRVMGDVICAAQNVTITGQVGDDVRLAAQTVNIQKDIGGDVSVFAQSINVDKQAMIGGDLNGAAESLNIKGVVSKNLFFGGENLNLSGQVKGTSQIAFEKVDATGVFEGSVFYESSKKLPIKSKSGEVVYHQLETHSKGVGVVGVILNLVMLIVSMVLFALLIALLAPRFLERSKDMLAKKPANVILFGLLATLVLPFVSLIVLFTLVGAPIGLMGLVVWAGLMILSGPFFAYLVGSTLAKPVKNVILRMLIGSLVVLVLYLVPIVNILVGLTAAVLGSGLVVQGLTNGYKKPTYKISAKASK